MDKPRDLTPLSEYAVALTAWVIERNTDNKKEPFFARLDEMLPIVQEDFKEAMRRLVREKILTYHPDLNGRMMFEFTQSK